MEAVMIFGELEFRQIGNLAAAPTFRQNDDGSKVANVRVITNIGWTDKRTGEQKDRAEGFNFEVWGEGAEHIRKLESGQEIYIVAEPYNHKYEKDGEPQYSIRFRVTRWRALGRKGTGAGRVEGAGGDGVDDDAPF
jgi:single-strand DNA-binding protein